MLHHNVLSSNHGTFTRCKIKTLKIQKHVTVKLPNFVSFKGILVLKLVLRSLESKDMNFDIKKCQKRIKVDQKLNKSTCSYFALLA